MAIGVAIIGAGLFGKGEYLPAIQKDTRFSLKAVYSRSSRSALEFGETASVDAYYESPETPDRSLDNLWQRPDIDAVVIALPILAQPKVIRAALKSGKHVLSEKPIAQDSTVAQELCDEYASSYRNSGLVWSVAENFRFLDPITYGAQQLERLGGTVTSFQISVHDLIREGNPYFATEWRKKPEYQGGFILDGGVHFVAGLRHLLLALNDSIVKVMAFSTQIAPHLPPVDSLHGALLLKSGRSGVINFSFGTEFKNDFLIEVVGSKGSVSVTSAGVTVTEKDASGEQREQTKAFPEDTGVKLEIETFGKAIESRTGDARQTPEEALIDLKILEALLRSGEQGGMPFDV